MRRCPIKSNTVLRSAHESRIWFSSDRSCSISVRFGWSPENASIPQMLDSLGRVNSFRICGRFLRVTTLWLEAWSSPSSTTVRRLKTEQSEQLVFPFIPIVIFIAFSYIPGTIIRFFAFRKHRQIIQDSFFAATIHEDNVNNKPIKLTRLINGFFARNSSRRNKFGQVAFH